MEMYNHLHKSSTVQGRETLVPAAKSLQTGSKSSSSCNRLDSEVDPMASPSRNAKGRTKTETSKKLMRIMQVSKEERIHGKGRNALKEAVDSGTELTKEQAWDILGKLISDLRGFVEPKVNVHKPIKNQVLSIEGVFETLQMLENQKQSEPQTVTLKQAELPVVEVMDTGGEGDSESVASDIVKDDSKNKKKRGRSSPEPVEEQVTKKLDAKQSPPTKAAASNTDKKQATAWKLVQSKKELKKQKKEQLQKELSKKLRPEPKRKKPRIWTRPDAIIVRPVKKDQYADILRRIKTDVKDDQASSFVEKISKTQSGNMLITLSKESTDKGQALQKAIAEVLKEEVASFLFRT